MLVLEREGEAEVGGLPLLPSLEAPDRAPWMDSLPCLKVFLEAGWLVKS